MGAKVQFCGNIGREYHIFVVMKNLFGVLKYVNGYWRYGIWNIIFNILSVIFGVFSLVMILPFLSLLIEPDDSKYR
jgi:hypothetical protein